MVDVSLLVDQSDDPAQRTLAEVMAREGWTTSNTESSARCAVVVWSQRSEHSQALAAGAEPYLTASKLLQILLRPKGSPLDDSSGGVEAPEPFNFYEGAILEEMNLDGSERSVDNQFGALEPILKELARLGALKRPRDAWNAHIAFHQPMWARAREVRLVERARDDGRVLRRPTVTTMITEVGHNYGPFEFKYDTTIGNRWQLLDPKTEAVLSEVKVRRKNVSVQLPHWDSWWQKVRHG